MTHQLAGYEDLERNAVALLRRNDLGTHIAPSLPHYPHQWLWDSAYSAIGLTHVDPARATTEIVSVLDGQWATGMIPHMIDRGPTRNTRERLGRAVWSTQRNRNAPRGLLTSGITQPPVLADATRRVAQALPPDAAARFLRLCVPRIVKYHEWFYRERDLRREGLVTSVHPWETGMDNTPVWMGYLAGRPQSLLVRLATTAPLRTVVRRLRDDVRDDRESQRISIDDGIRCIAALLTLRRGHYAYPNLYASSVPCIQDVAVNSILVRNNAVLRELAGAIDFSLPLPLLDAMARAVDALHTLWDDSSGLYASRDPRTGRLLGPPTVAGLLPLYAGQLPQSRLSALVAQLGDPRAFASKFPVPTVPVASPEFRELGYWSGPSWINMNWHLIDGLSRCGQHAEADRLATQTIGMVARAGMYEYFSPLDGRRLGMPGFSWTAALTLDLLRGAVPPVRTQPASA